MTQEDIVKNDIEDEASIRKLTYCQKAMIESCKVRAKGKYDIALVYNCAYKGEMQNLKVVKVINTEQFKSMSEDEFDNEEIKFILESCSEKCMRCSSR